MSNTPLPSYLENHVSQIPALRLLMAMGWTYLSPKQADALRDYRRSNVILTGVLRPWLRDHNHITHKGQTVPFSEANLAQAIRALEEVRLGEGLIKASEDIYKLLSLPKSVEQSVGGDKRGFDLRYIDWAHPSNNVYHVTEEFSVTRRGASDTRRPDIVLFVNGIPLVVIECKRPDKQTAGGEKSVYAGVNQLVNYQAIDEIPHLFAYAQLLLSVNTNEALYATASTPKKFWATWLEESPDDSALSALINAPLSEADKLALYGWRPDSRQVQTYFDRLDAAGERQSTAQDRTLAALLPPSRLLELAYQFIVYDGGHKKIARYQQYFAIKATVERVQHIGADGMRAGGVIWHTTGSGKSLTMVMLAKALALPPTSFRVVIVTDRIDLDEQIWGTFKDCGLAVTKATSGKHLIELIRGRKGVITTIIDKFEAAAREKLRDPSPDVLVLVDESHRGQYGSSHAQMREVFPNGCYIGFTGTPLMKKDKQTAEKFGGFIHKYTMRQAVSDGAVVPLLYEGRLVDLVVHKDMLDQWFERRTRDLTESQQTDLKKKMSRADEINNTLQRMTLIAFDVAEHYKRNFRDSETGLKGQFATGSREQALNYRRLLREEDIRCEVIMSAPDTREGSDPDGTPTERIANFWAEMMGKYGNPDTYLREVLRDFHEPDGIEIVIVVDKLLVGFDEPRNTVLYVDKSLREHGLLQAIARVNRLFAGKDYGYIVDYYGVLGELNEALDTYNALEQFDAEDVADTVTDVGEVLDDLPVFYQQLWAVFNGVKPPRDNEAFERFLEPENIRQGFYDALNQFVRAFKVALSAVEFYQKTADADIAKMKHDVKFFHKLRQSVQQRYAETINYGEYEQKIRKLLSDHVQAQGLSVLTPEVNIFDEAAFAAATAHLSSDAGRADTIVNQIKKTATENLDKDPAFYRKFSELVEAAIQQYRDGRMTELEYLQQAEGLLAQFRTGHTDDLPESLRHTRDASAYYGLLVKAAPNAPKDSLVTIALDAEATINKQKVRDWTANLDVTRRIRGLLDDLLFEAQFGLSDEVVDLLLEALIETAKHRDTL